jgi:hypothetical protein
MAMAPIAPMPHAYLAGPARADEADKNAQRSPFRVQGTKCNDHYCFGYLLTSYSRLAASVHECDGPIEPLQAARMSLFPEQLRAGVVLQFLFSDCCFCLICDKLKPFLHFCLTFVLLVADGKFS